MSSREQAEALIRSIVQGEPADAVVAALRASAWVRNFRVELDAEIAIGASKFGGAPDLPQGVSWPAARAKRTFRWLRKYHEAKRRPDGSLPAYDARVLAELHGDDASHTWPLDFFAQFNLADLPVATAMGLPAGGMLYFFYNDDYPIGGVSDNRDLLQVFHLDASPQQLIRALYPGSPARFERSRPCRLEFEFRTMLPLGPGTQFDRVEGYRELLGQLMRGMPQPRHWIGGYPYPIQDDVFLDLEMTARRPAWPKYNPFSDRDEASRNAFEHAMREVRAASQSWQLLLQLDTDEKTGWSWGDVGTMYFLIRAEDLRARHFRRTEALQQCH